MNTTLSEISNVHSEMNTDLKTLKFTKVPIDFELKKWYELHFSAIPQELTDNESIKCFIACVGEPVHLPDGWSLIVWIRPTIKGKKLTLSSKKKKAIDDYNSYNDNSVTGENLFFRIKNKGIKDRELRLKIAFLTTVSQVTGKRCSRLYLSANLFYNTKVVGASYKIPLYFRNWRHSHLKDTVANVLTDPETGYRRIYFKSNKLPEHLLYLKVNPYVLGVEPKKIFKIGKKISVKYDGNTGEIVSYPIYQE